MTNLKSLKGQDIKRIFKELSYCFSYLFQYQSKYSTSYCFIRKKIKSNTFMLCYLLVSCFNIPIINNLLQTNCLGNFFKYLRLTLSFSVLRAATVVRLSHNVFRLWLQQPRFISFCLLHQNCCQYSCEIFHEIQL